MRVHELHPEDVKAEIRKRFGTVRDFERTNGLPIGGVRDILRGRTSERIERAIESVLIEASDTPALPSGQPQKSVNHKRAAAA